MTRSRGGNGDDFDVNQFLQDFRKRQQGNVGSVIRWVIIGAAVLLLLVAIFALPGFLTDWFWFDSLGYTQIFQTFVLWQVGVFIVGTAVFFLFAMLNVGLAQRLSPKGPVAFEAPEELASSMRLVNWGIIGSAVLAALVMGGIAGETWPAILLYLNSTPFGVTDPVFGRDAGFYVFDLPVQRALQGWLLGTTVLTALAAGAVYVTNFVLRRKGVKDITLAVRAHVLGLGAVAMVLLAWGYQLEIPELAYASNDLFVGASYTDVNAQVLALQVLTAVALLTAALMLVSIVTGGFSLPAFGVGSLVVVGIVMGNVYPGIVQRFQVAPNELEREAPFLAANIAMTRYAFGLDQVEEIPFPADDTLPYEAIQRNQSTIDNIRLWDPRPLRETYNQIQSIRAYYGFNDVDVDRYTVDGNYRQVMVSARELLIQQLAAQAQTWTNRTLQFTHGYGVAMSPVNEVTREGLPVLFLRDIPPVGQPTITRPEIYFGERTNWTIIVRTREQEFDYPSGDGNVFTTYQEDAGVPLDSFWKRALYAWDMGDLNILISEQLLPESRILYRRDIRERVRTLAPFLTLDADPYIVADQTGRLVWIQDAFTTSRRFPHSQPSPTGINYIRNSVKITIDAYNGEVNFYVSDPGDPLIQTWERVFPGVFKPLDQLPNGLINHLRYPEDLFLTQARTYQLYHMTDPRVFYNREDVFRFPREIFDTQEQDVVPYYVIINLPATEEDKEEFVLMMPFTPGGQRNNTIAWMAGRADAENYGRLLAYQFPRDRLVFGPLQLESRISQDPRISAQFSLWSNGGARIIRGNLLMIPIENSFLYVEPIFLQAQNSSLPELKRVIAATGNRIAMEATLPEAIEVLYGRRAPSALEGTGTQTATGLPGATPVPGTGIPVPVVPTAVPTPVQPVQPVQPIQPIQPGASPQELSRAAVESYNRAQEALRRGDFAAYGEEIRRLEAILDQLVRETGG